MNPRLKEKIFLGIIAVLSLAVIVDVFDRPLAVGIVFIASLSAITLLILRKIGLCTKTICALFFIALIIHLGAVIFVSYSNFQPFSGGRGDYLEYGTIAQEVAQRVQHGNFSLQGISYGHFYPAIIGYIYALTMPEVLIGQMFNAFLAALLAIFVYFIVREMRGSEKEGFVSGLLTIFYPSLLFFGSLLLKEVLAALICSIALLLILKIINKFSWTRFALLYASLLGLIHFREYIGFAAIITFIVCWFIFSNLKIRKRLVYGAIFVVLLGFLPIISAGEGTGSGYYGVNFFKAYLNRNTITHFREELSIPSPNISPETGFPTYDAPLSDSNITETGEVVAKPVTKRGRGSVVTVETGFDNAFSFVKNSLIALTYATLGPFPWQMRYLRHLLVLPELLLWYLALFFTIKGIRRPARSNVFVILIFSFIVFSTLSVYLCDFGITTRIRIPAFIAVFCLAPFGFKRLKNIKIPFLNI